MESGYDGDGVMVETVYSVNRDDEYEVHHPEPECHHRQTIIEKGNDETGEVGNSAQDLVIMDDDLIIRRWLRRCFVCQTIETNRRLGIRIP